MMVLRLLVCKLSNAKRKKTMFSGFMSVLAILLKLLQNKEWIIDSGISVRNPPWIWKIFYLNGRKIVPENISTLIVSPLTLAVWFMDDGSLDYRVKSHYSFSFSTDAFKVKEVRLLQNVLKNRFKIESSIQTPSSRGKQYTKLYIGKDGRERFLKIISPYILSCFSYKIPPKNA